MKSTSPLTFILFWLSGGCVASAAAAPFTVEVASPSLPISIADSYRKVVKIEHARGFTLSLRKRVDWSFSQASGSILLVDAKSRAGSTCVAYLVRGEVLRSLGGNEHCTWSGTPHLRERAGHAWVEFPRRIGRQAQNPDIGSSEMTLHFDKARGDACLLGLPGKGFDDLVCPDGEAPLSE